MLHTGAIYHGEVLTAEAEGIFIELVPQKFMKHRGENSDSPKHWNRSGPMPGASAWTRAPPNRGSSPS